MKLLVVVLFAFLSYQSFSQPYSLEWRETYNFPFRPKTNKPTVCCSSIDGSFWVAGRRDSVTNDQRVVIRKYDSHGHFLLERWFSHSNNIDARAIATDKNGNVYVGCVKFTTNSDDILILKYDSAGTFKWQFNYDDSIHGSDHINKIYADQALNVYFLGVKQFGPSFNTPGMFTAKLDSSGNLIWEKNLNRMFGYNPVFNLTQDNQQRLITIQGSDTTFIQYMDTAGNSLSAWYEDSTIYSPPATAADDSGNVFIAYFHGQVRLRRYDITGNIIWEWQGTGAINKLVLDYPYIYLAGTSGTTIYLNKYDYSGHMHWSKQYVDPTPLLLSKMTYSFVLSNGKLYLGGSNADTNYVHDTYIHQFDTAGNLLRNRTFNYLNGEDEHYAACVNDSGIYLYTGSNIRHIDQTNWMIFACDSSMQDTVYENNINYQHSWESNLRINKNLNNDILQYGTSYDTTGAMNVNFIKYDDNGNLIWNTPVRFVDHAKIYPGNMVADSNENYFGYGCINNQNKWGGYICMVDSNGILQWSKLLQFIYTNYVEINSLAVDNAGGLYLYQSSKELPGIYPSYLIKLNYNGDSLWSKKLDSIPGSTNSTNIFFRNNMLYMFGETKNTLNGNFYFSRSDTAGNILQCSALNGPLSNLETKGRMIQDSQNNFIAFGCTSDTIVSVNPTSWYIVKADSLGNILWDTKFTSTTGIYDAPLVACTDANNNIYISGNSEDDGSIAKWMIRKLDPNGNVQWQDSLPFRVSTITKMEYHNGQVHTVLNEANTSGSDYLVYDTTGILLYMDSTDATFNDLIITNDKVYMAGTLLNDTTYYDMVLDKYNNLTSNIKFTDSRMESLNVYPNPSTREFNVEFNIENHGGYEVKAYNQNSSLLFSKNVVCMPGENHVSIQLPGVAVGVVYVTIKGSGYLSSGSIIITR